MAIGSTQNEVILPLNSLNDLTTVYDDDGDDAEDEEEENVAGGSWYNDVPAMFNRHKNKEKMTVTRYLNGSLFFPSVHLVVGGRF